MASKKDINDQLSQLHAALASVPDGLSAEDLHVVTRLEIDLRTLQRRLDALIKDGRVSKDGQGPRDPVFCRRCCDAAFSRDCRDLTTRHVRARLQGGRRDIPLCLTARPGEEARRVQPPLPLRLPAQRHELSDPGRQGAARSQQSNHRRCQCQSGNLRAAHPRPPVDRPLLEFQPSRRQHLLADRYAAPDRGWRGGHRQGRRPRRR